MYPPPPASLGDCLSNLEKFLHSKDMMPELIKIGLAHAQFETIHPFFDGNGGAGRLLMTFLFCEREILQSPVLYISHYFRQRKQEYYDHLQATRDNGDWESWLKFFLRGVCEVSKEATKTARNIVALREKHRTEIAENFGRVAANGLTVLEQLFQNPITTVTRIMNVTGASFTAASSLTNRLLKNGMLTEMTSQARNRQFNYGAYVDLFSS